MNDFNDAIYNPDFNLSGPHLVAASAGTGKTYNIQNIYARLIAETGFQVSQIQVMTFTEAATHELRDRIRKILMLYSQYLSNASLADNDRERIEALWACAKKVVGTDDDEARRIVRGRIELALMQFDQASISTIHGFCRRVLSRFAFETNTAFNAELEDRKLYDLSVLARDWWRNQINGGEDISFTIGDLQKTLGGISSKNGWLIDASEDDKSILRIAQDLLNRYDSKRSSRDVQSFDDLLKALCDALSDGSRGDILASMLRDEYKAALIDEFQDTDPVQYEIFRRIFLDVPNGVDKPSLFFVGDPKQAIYAFRGGDIYTYRKAATRSDIIDSNTYQLTQNFRSTPKLIEAVNLIFKDNGGRYTFNDDTITYDTDLRADDKREPYILEDGKPDSTPFRVLLVNDKKERIAAVVESVLGVLSEKLNPKVSPKDIAILASSHSDISEYASALREKGVPIVIQNSGNVFASQIAKEFFVLLRAMALIGGRANVKAALTTSFFEYDIKDLVKDAETDILADAIAFFTKINHIWLSKGFRAAFSTYEAEYGMRKRFAGMDNGERLLADILQLADLATEAALRLGPSPEILVNWMIDRLNKAESDEAEVEEYARELESENDAVRLMTMHVSKGLQFPVVIVPLSGRNDAKKPYFYHENDLFYVSTNEDSKVLAGVENDNEKIRLQYVAFTRAEKRTVVISAIAGRSANPTFISLLENAKKNAGVSIESDYPITLGPIRIEEFSSTAGNLPSYTPPVAEVKSWVELDKPESYSSAPLRGSYSSLTPTAEIDAGEGHDYDGSDDKTADEQDGVDIFSVPGGAKTGTCWHEILEKASFDISDEELRNEVELSMRLHGLTNQNEQLFISRVGIVAEMMKKTLDYELTAPDGEVFSLRDVGLSDRISEWEFDFSSQNAAETTREIADILRVEWADDEDKKLFVGALAGWDKVIPRGFLKGFIDLLFRHNGKYYIVDWKSNSLNFRRSGFCKDGINAEMAAAGYFFQYLLYSVVLHRFLKERLGEGYSWNENFGGIRYYFLRGIAVDAEAPIFADRPSEALLDKLAAVLGLEDR